MNLLVVLVRLGSLGFGLGFVGALLVRRPRVALAGGSLGVASAYLLSVLAVGEDAPFAGQVVRAGAVAAGVGWLGVAAGVWAASELERHGRL
ncbi:MAG: hypothetical protein KatS3mg012_1575 [Gaiellaceae bacterium]|nr:MAG: hypothetical protein KatS3mg012_1575 [Gaiellaceae bacterium]